MLLFPNYPPLTSLEFIEPSLLRGEPRRLSLRPKARGLGLSSNDRAGLRGSSYAWCNCTNVYISIAWWKVKASRYALVASDLTRGEESVPMQRVSASGTVLGLKRPNQSMTLGELAFEMRVRSQPLRVTNRAPVCRRPSPYTLFASRTTPR